MIMKYAETKDIPPNELIGCGSGLQFSLFLINIELFTVLYNGTAYLVWNRGNRMMIQRLERYSVVYGYMIGPE